MKQFLSIPSLLRSVLLPADYTSFLSRGVNSFPYIFLENPEIVLTDWHLPALMSQLSQHGLEFSNVFSLLLLLTWDPGWPKGRSYFLLTFPILPSLSPPGKNKLNIPCGQEQEPHFWGFLADTTEKNVFLASTFTEVPFFST